MVAGRCQRQDCPGFSFDDAEHMEDAIQKLRSHYRTEHPAKYFYEPNIGEDLDAYNLNLDEQIGRYSGVNNWREAGNLADRHIVSACQQIVRYHRGTNPIVVDGAIALAREHGTEIPDPRNQPAENAENIAQAGMGINAPNRLVEIMADEGIMVDNDGEEPF